MSACGEGGHDADACLEARYHDILVGDYGLTDEALRHLEGDLSVLEGFRSVDEAERYLAEHHRDRARFAGFPNAYWRRLLQDLLGLWGSDEQAPIRRARIFVGQIPEPRLNASTRRCGGGRFLILINHGLARFLSTAARIIVAGMGDTLGTSLTREPVDRARLRALMQVNFEMLFSAAESDVFVEMGKAGQRAVIGATYALEQAVMGHEIGHVVVALAESGRELSPPDPHLEEYAADDVGQRLCGLLTEHAVTTLGLDGLQAELFLAAAPHWLCLLIAQVEERSRRRGMRLLGTHPGGGDRARRIRERQIAEGIPEIDLEFVDRSCALLSELTTP